MKQNDNKKLPVSLKRVANMGRLLFDSVLAILFTLYGIGIYGVIQSIKAEDDKELNFYTIVLCFNFIAITTTFYLIVKLWN